MDGFVNRAAELAALQRWWDSGHPVAAVWGRRRMGKTLLVDEFAGGRRTITHTGAGRGDLGELRLLAHEVAEALPDAVGSERSPGDAYRTWSEAFDDIRSRSEGASVLLVLDNLPDLLNPSEGLVEALQMVAAGAGAAGNPRREPVLRVILVGSRVRQLEALQQPGQVLHGVAAATLVLEPFTPREVALVLDRLTPVERARVYGTVGGIPLYLSWWDQDATLEENVDRLVCRPGAPLLTEGDLLLGADLDEPGYNDRVLHGLAAGLTSYNDVRDWAGTEPARPLDRLIELRLIERVLPVGESRQARRRRYRITDPFVGFHLGVVSARRAEIDRGQTRRLAAELVAAADRTMGSLWVEAFRRHLEDLAAAGELPIEAEALQVGPWWDNTGKAEIDALVLAGEPGTPVAAGAATWAPEVQARALVEELRGKVERGLGAYPHQLRYAVCGREAVHDLPYDALGFTAEDLFGPPP